MPPLFLEIQVITTAVTMGTRVLVAAPTAGTVEVVGTAIMGWYLGCRHCHDS